jgi:uncharacterized protein (DUF1800 family)
MRFPYAGVYPEVGPSAPILTREGSLTVEAVIAANRFGLGARPGELKAIGSDARDWLAAQLKGKRSTPAPVKALPSSAEAFKLFEAQREERRDRRESDRSNGKSSPPRDAENLRLKLRDLYLDQAAARYRVAASTDEPFRERLVHFWSNHFAVSADKVQVLAIAGALENEAVRPNLAGRFADLLQAAVAHPAMILYLDNQASIGPNSKVARRAGARARNAQRKLDINENLAREILELHTLGVNGGYTQQDVTTFALALTGWSVGTDRGPFREGDAGEFEFREAVHEPGARTVLGKRYAEDGVRQPRAILADLAVHPSTATHIATKLVRHFVADTPPAECVERVARVFRQTGGDLPSVHRSLIELPQTWSRETPKFKTPHDFVVSTFRLLAHVPEDSLQAVAPFELLGQRPWSPGSPAGWADTADGWDGPDALLKRIEWASAVGDRVGARVTPERLALQALGETLSTNTRTAISRAASAAQGLTLLLASPEFQRR